MKRLLMVNGSGETLPYHTLIIRNIDGLKFTYNGIAWDTHIKELVTVGKRMVNSLLRILNNPCLSLYVKRQVILSILQPLLEYGSEVWRCTTSQSKALDAVLLAACKKILGCSSKTCSEAVWSDSGIEPLNLRRNKRKVVWFLRLLKKGKDSFCKKVFKKEWNKCKIPGRKRKQWKKCVLDIISDMDLTSTSLASKEAVLNINNAFKNFVISSLHSGMCKKSN